MSVNSGRVVDVHLHPPIFSSLPEGWDAFMRDNQPEGSDWLRERYGTPEQLLQYLDENGVETALLLAEVAPATSALVTSEAVADFCMGQPRLLACASINPYLVSQPGRELERLVRERGVRGLKLYPSYAFFYPNDPMLSPLYAAAERLGVPVLVHTGTSVFPGSRLKYGDPLYLDDVAVDFPELKILLCHGGRTFWYDRAEALVRLHRNVYIDVAGLPPRKLPVYFPQLERLGHKFVFGSDWPGMPGDIRDNIAAIRQLPLSEEQIEGMLGGTAARLLGI
ncbi:MAG: amidohydrolase [Chloroflexi bacterium]|nr:amidohydrolase [Chloroflexota bacterium]